jgi:hypothetical protein
MAQTAKYSLIFLSVMPYSLHIVTDLINALPGNISVNKVQHTTTDETVFYVIHAMPSVVMDQ